MDKVISTIIALNNEISNDASLGDGFMIGHSYFCNLIGDYEEKLKSILKFDIIPMIREYWFDDENKQVEVISKINNIKRQ